MDLAEGIAKLVVEAALPGAKMVFRDEQSHGEYDFDLCYPNGTIAALEVTESANQSQKWLDAKIKEDGWVIKARVCKKSWAIRATDAKTIPAIRKNIDKLLAEVEREGCENFNYHDAFTTRRKRNVGVSGILPPPVPRCVEDICCDLKIQCGRVISNEGAPQIHILPPLRSGSRGQNTPIKAGEREAQKRDNRRKLGASKAEQRHLAVYIGDTSGLAKFSLADFQPRAVVASLPEEITHIWLIGYSGRSNEFIVWRASTTGCWCSQRVITRLTKKTRIAHS
jgi:hypothetical protein